MRTYESGSGIHSVGFTGPTSSTDCSQSFLGSNAKQDFRQRISDPTKHVVHSKVNLLNVHETLMLPKLRRFGCSDGHPIYVRDYNRTAKSIRGSGSSMQKFLQQELTNAYFIQVKKRSRHNKNSPQPLSDFLKSPSKYSSSF